MSSRVFHILAQKGNTVITVRADDPVLDVATTLARHNIGGAPVLGADDQLVGMISEKVIVHALSQRGADISTLTAKDIMTRDTPTATPDDSIYDIACRMTYSRSRHVPVMENGKLAGLVSIGDIVKLRAENAEQEARELQDYVTGSDHGAVKSPNDAPPMQCGDKES
ncbi:CBS domain-containing protein [Komagataeibacter intermedius]|uniref:Cystathionine beta-synthase n=2 Tax=Komagataeibacter intermedius TaxID=66229 RepID=A0A0N1FD66_9PROT|nr:CBS domain-containing protein [Komagataeibacter intermedius]KPH88165.1 cystathionine beta-synthase [Komagataeibacter intermedius AF2]MCF3635904.1 CBS domain-containing protein [Komagataeibacter intermedius]GAN86431.1 signal transduction protein with CBS [Komagataeibacter intermedius TF2]GBQ68225.1 putative cystathionine-beta-synthase O [Komagataeibacter intermedius NRIC 0521]